MITFSVVLPAKDEMENITVLLQEIDIALATEAYEIILVDDGSGDNTADVALNVSTDLRGKVIVIRHEKSCGQSTALYTAVQHARGEYIAVLDADGQNNPVDILRLYNMAKTLSAKHWVVMGHRTQRQDSGWKRFQSRFANRFRQAILRDDCPDTGCGLKLLPRLTYLQLPYFNHMHRFIPVLVKRMGGEVRNVPVHHRPRHRGQSKYNAWNRAWAGLLDILGVLWLLYRARQPVVAWIKTSQEHR